MCKAGLARDVHSKDLMFPLRVGFFFFFLNRNFGFCQHRNFERKPFLSKEDKDSGISQRTNLEETADNGSVNYKLNITTKLA